MTNILLCSLCVIVSLAQIGVNNNGMVNCELFRYSWPKSMQMSQSIDLTIESIKFGTLNVMGVVEALVDTQASRERDAPAVASIAQLLPQELHNYLAKQELRNLLKSNDGQLKSEECKDFVDCVISAIKSSDKLSLVQLRNEQQVDAAATLVLAIERIQAPNDRQLYIFTVGDSQALVYRSLVGGKSSATTKLEALTVRGDNQVNAMGQAAGDYDKPIARRPNSSIGSGNNGNWKQKSSCRSWLFGSCIAPPATKDSIVTQESFTFDNTLADAKRKASIDSTIKSTCKPQLTGHWSIDANENSIKFVVIGNKRLWRTSPVGTTITDTIKRTLCFSRTNSPAEFLVDIAKSKQQSEQQFDERYNNELIAQIKLFVPRKSGICDTE